MPTCPARSPHADPTARLLTAVAALPLLGVALAYLVTPIDDLLVRVIPDDAVFYLVLARNGAEGAFSSFDGIRATSGYHPSCSRWRG